PGTITLESALPDLNNNITINGLRAGASTVQRDPAASSSFRIFTVDAGKTVSLSDLTIAGGIADNGGGIENFGTVTVSGSSFTGNSASGGDGGGLYNEGTATVIRSSFTGNSEGGGRG